MLSTGKLKFAAAAAVCLAASGLLGPAASAAAAVQAPSAAAKAPIYKPGTSKFPVIGANHPVLGVNLWAKQNYTAAQTQVYGTRMLSYIKNVLHAGAVDIVWNFFAPSYASNQVVWTPSTLTVANVAILTKIAQQDHLLVEYRPMMFVLNVVNNWEGKITPSNDTQWFDAYYHAMIPYLHMAERYHVNEYVTGTEMDGVSQSPLWNSFLIKCAEIYQGVLSYADHQYRYFPPRTQLPPVGLVGLDDYEPLNLPATATLAQVTAAYEHYFTTVPASLLRRTALDETGIQARAGAYQEPSFMYIPGTLDPEVQANWYTAACRAVKRFRLRAVFIWKVDLADNPAHPASSLSTFEGRVGAQAIGGCAAILAG
jgi:hypothetical protein